MTSRRTVHRQRSGSKWNAAANISCGLDSAPCFLTSMSGATQQLTLRQRTIAAWLWSHRQGVIAGLTAAAWHGSKWVDEHLPIELIWSNARPPRGLRTYDMTLAPGGVARRRGPAGHHARNAPRSTSVAASRWASRVRSPRRPHESHRHQGRAKSSTLPTGIAEPVGSGSWKRR